MVGTAFNQYQITAALGSGGMGEVFRARDTRLNRDVAIKVLPKDFAADADRLRRFEQEAKTLAALNHPNVLTIHDAGVHDGAPYLVSELLQGQTLREVLGSTPGTPLPSRKVIDVTLQVVNGLAAAHGKGIIHRDLKPENIFVTSDGRVKILDFGLAKLQVGRVAPRAPLDTADSPDGARGATRPTIADADAPTVVQSAAQDSTEPGKIMGTPSSLAPEQVRGEAVDHRSDIFAFGCVLYEMLSGTRAFKRDTPIESMNAILNDEPRHLAELNSTLTPALVRVVVKCLAKGPDERWQTTKDLADELRWLTQTGSKSSQRGPVHAPQARRLWSSRLGWAAISVALAVSLASHWWANNRPEAKGISRFTIFVDRGHLVQRQSAT